MKKDAALLVISLLVCDTTTGAEVYRCKDQTGYILKSAAPCPKEWPQVWSGSEAEFQAAFEREKQQTEERRLAEKARKKAAKEREDRLLAPIKLDSPQESNSEAWISAGKGGPVYNSPWDGSVREVERHLKESLKDPDSYDGIEWSPVATKLVNGERMYAVRHKYRAKNSFGGYVIEERLFLMDESGRVTESMDSGR